MQRTSGELSNIFSITSFVETLFYRGLLTRYRVGEVMSLDGHDFVYQKQLKVLGKAVECEQLKETFTQIL